MKHVVCLHNYCKVLLNLSFKFELQKTNKVKGPRPSPSCYFTLKCTPKQTALLKHQIRFMNTNFTLITGDWLHVHWVF